MDLLQKEIARKRKELEEANLLKNESNKKYFKRGELQEKQAEVYIKKLEQLHQTEQLKTIADQSRQDEKDEKKNKAIKSKEEEYTEKVLPRNDVIKRLRERGQPIRLFGESDEAAAKRLNILETNEVETNGMRNDFKAAMDKTEQESLNEIMNSIDPEHATQQQAIHDADEKDDETVLNEIIELSKIKNDRNNDSVLVIRFFKLVMKKWANELNCRSLEEKLTVQGRIETALHGQTDTYLKPLFRKLKARKLADDILDSLVKIVLELIKRDYIRANEFFLECAIGNAPWPIGATMVGIHARPGRERIASKHVAHVLNDETQRKYIQAVKRLISKCQKYFTAEPSRCVEYGLKNENITIIPGGK